MDLTKKFRSILQYKNYIKPFYTRRYYYSMPEQYYHSFYNANSQLFECINYYLHGAYEIVYKDLVKEFMKRRECQENLARKSILNSIKCIEHCNHLLDVHIPVKMNNGSYEIVRGFRAYHGLYNMKRPSLGGLRLCVDAERDHIKALSILSTYKNALIGVNMAGAHGALKILKNNFNEEDLKRVFDCYVKELSSTTNPDQIDIYEPDMYCKTNEISWFMEALLKNQAKNLIVVGAQNNFFGESAYYILKHLLDDVNLMNLLNLPTGLKNKTFICDGLGKMGVAVAKRLEEAGAICIGFKEIDCFLHDAKGFSLTDLLGFKKQSGSFKGYSPNLTEAESDIVLTKPCDILVLSSSHKTLNCYMADNLNAKIVLECSSISITPTAHKILVGRHILVIPDILATCGISLANGLEYINYSKGAFDANVMERNFVDAINVSLRKKHSALQRNQGSSEVLVNCNNISLRMEYILNDVVEGVLETMQDYKLKLDLRTAAYIFSIKKLFNWIIDCERK